ncbi:unnamed protein product [Cyprideis torosa]|uniref:Hedgehog protein n=1 Tax=Cyprideis torosa TaxID=163714 RepID=A0A7R8W4J2_9CRUS|nr:unnamed protein product [Cyprideis torosa]CAG0884256.1 unnamed protein product [Cyprideis torosa]
MNVARSVEQALKLALFLLVICDFLVQVAVCCGPGRRSGRRARARRLIPLVYKQHIPNVNEHTLGASGLPEGRILNGDDRFKELVVNYNQDIIFKDDEGTGSDRVMTKVRYNAVDKIVRINEDLQHMMRLKEKLNTLAISVMNQWPGVRLRVLDSWEELDGQHSPDSLHYEGRAVDITTSDRDRSKYGMLARLAVEAGFDWVYYESRSHIHCSVKSESSEAAKSGGCFPGSSLVRTPSGVLPLTSLRPGQQVLSWDSAQGQFVYSDVLLFLDSDPFTSRSFYRVRTDSGAELSLTESHLIYVGQAMAATYAGRLRVGDRVWLRGADPRGGNSSLLHSEEVTDLRMVRHQGFFAPLTRQGNVVVDDFVVSCYAVVDSEAMANAAFLPLRWWTSFTSWLTEGATVSSARSDEGTQGVHWYAKLLYSLARYFLPSHLMYT